MRVAIIGGGFTGLGAAYFLKKKYGADVDITIYESNPQLGGLATGFNVPGWEWSIEKYIHHWFLTDTCVLDIIKEIGKSQKLIVRETKSSCFYKGATARLDSASSLLTFPFVPLKDRIRMGAVLALLRADSNYHHYEGQTAEHFIKKYMGKQAYEKVWHPLLEGKFGKWASHIDAAWFWGRVNPRTKKLAYYAGGFQNFTSDLGNFLKNKGVKIFLDTKVSKITKHTTFKVTLENSFHEYDRVILATPLSVASKLVNFPKEYVEKYDKIHFIGAQYYVLELDKPFLPGGTYWLNVNHADFPFMLVAEHTNFIDKKYYGNKHVIWVGKYLDYENPLWNMSEPEYYDLVIKHLSKINSSFSDSNVLRKFFFKGKDAQHIVSVGYPALRPPLESPIPGLYMGNISNIYPLDRSTNNGMLIGKEIAEMIR